MIFDLPEKEKEILGISHYTKEPCCGADRIIEYSIYRIRSEITNRAGLRSEIEE